MNDNIIMKNLTHIHTHKPNNIKLFKRTNIHIKFYQPGLGGHALNIQEYEPIKGGKRNEAGKGDKGEELRTGFLWSWVITNIKRHD